MHTKAPILAIVIPCYNEEAMLPHAFTILQSFMQTLKMQKLIAEESFIYCVDDGSADRTWHIISEAHHNNACLKGLKLSRNFGHQNAMLAGMMQVKDKVDCVVTMDADLQDDIQAITAMLQEFNMGSDIVCGVRKSRDHDSYFKRVSSHFFYRMMTFLGVNTVPQHADFRLLSQRALEKLIGFEERNLFLRGMVPLLGYKTTFVYYHRENRAFGTTKYSLKKMLGLAWDAVTSFSHRPLDFILIFGVISFLLSIMLIIWVVFEKMQGHVVPGWASIMIPLCFMGGVQLLSIGILGEYIAKIYIEVKRRPRYLEEQELF